MSVIYKQRNRIHELGVCAQTCFLMAWVIKSIHRPLAYETFPRTRGEGEKEKIFSRESVIVLLKPALLMLPIICLWVMPRGSTMNVTAVEFNKREMSRLNVFFVQGPCLVSSPGGCVPRRVTAQGSRVAVAIRGR